jgi:hypothetical protein
MPYNIGDMVRFYPNVGTDQVFVGEIIRVSLMNDNWYQYVIKYEGSNFYVNEKFIIEKVVPNTEDSENEMKARTFELINIRLTKQLEEELEVSMKLMEENDYLIKECGNLYNIVTELSGNILKYGITHPCKYEKTRKCLIMRDLEH